MSEHPAIREAKKQGERLADIISNRLEGCPELEAEDIRHVIFGLLTLAAGLTINKTDLIEPMYVGAAHAFWHVAEDVINRDKRREALDSVKEDDAKADEALQCGSLPIDLRLDQIIANAMKEDP